MTEERKGRRGLLGMVGLAAGTAAGSAAAFNPEGNRGNIPAQPEGEEEKRKPRYRETQHVRDFYRTNRS